MLKQVFADFERRLKTSIEAIGREVAKVRTGRASLAILDGVTVDYYGTPTPLNQVATLAVPEATLITAQPWDATLLPLIEKAIRSSDLGLNPANDGKIIRIPIPPMNEERRKQLARHVGKVLEEHRAALRHVRRDENDVIKKMLKDKEVSQDEEHRTLEEIQKLTDQFVARVEELAKQKEEEILTV